MPNQDVKNKEFEISIKNLNDTISRLDAHLSKKLDQIIKNQKAQDQRLYSIEQNYTNVRFDTEIVKKDLASFEKEEKEFNEEITKTIQKNENNISDLKTFNYRLTGAWFVITILSPIIYEYISKIF